LQLFFLPPKVYIHGQTLPRGTSIYTAELLAIRAALQYVSKYSVKNVIIFTDSVFLFYNPFNPQKYTNQ